MKPQFAQTTTSGNKKAWGVLSPGQMNSNFSGESAFVFWRCILYKTLLHTALFLMLPAIGQSFASEGRCAINSVTIRELVRFRRQSCSHCPKFVTIYKQRQVA